MTSYLGQCIGRFTNSFEKYKDQTVYWTKIQTDGEFAKGAFIRSTATCALLMVPFLRPPQSLAIGLGFSAALIKTLYQPKWLKRAPDMHIWTDERMLARIAFLTAIYFAVSGPIAHFAIGYTLVRAAHHSLICCYGFAYVDKVKNLIMG